MWIPLPTICVSEPLLRCLQGICMSLQLQILFLSDVGIFIVHAWCATQTRPQFNIQRRKGKPLVCNSFKVLLPQLAESTEKFDRSCFLYQRMFTFISFQPMRSDTYGLSTVSISSILLSYNFALNINRDQTCCKVIKFKRKKKCPINFSKPGHCDLLLF